MRKPKAHKQITKEIFVDHPDIGAAVWRHEYRESPTAPKWYYLRIMAQSWTNSPQIVVEQYFSRSAERNKVMMAYLEPAYETYRAKFAGRETLLRQRRDNQLNIVRGIGALLRSFGKLGNAGRSDDRRVIQLSPWDI
jgi:hypothetical protein